MKNNLLKVILFAFVLCNSFTISAQAFGTGSGIDRPSSEAINESEKALEGPEAIEAPINSNLILLGLAGGIFAFVYFSKNSKQNPLI